MNREGEKYKLVLYSFKVWITNGELTEFITLDIWPRNEYRTLRNSMGLWVGKWLVDLIYSSLVNLCGLGWDCDIPHNVQHEM